MLTKVKELALGDNKGLFFKINKVKECLPHRPINLLAKYPNTNLPQHVTNNTLIENSAHLDTWC